jgi:hypothetical protein
VGSSARRSLDGGYRFVRDRDARGRLVRAGWFWSIRFRYSGEIEAAASCEQPAVEPATRERNANFGSVGADKPLEILVEVGESAAASHARALEAMARQADLSPAAKLAFLRRASGLDGGRLHAPSASCSTNGAELSAADVR